MGVKYTHEGIADSIIRQVELDKRRSPILKWLPFPPRYDMIYQPLEANPRESWTTALRASAVQWAALWGIRFIYVTLLLLCAAVIDSTVAHGGRISIAVIGGIFMAVLALCALKMFIWAGRAREKAMGQRWRARMTREAEERLARDDPGRGR